MPSLESNISSLSSAYMNPMDLYMVRRDPEALLMCTGETRENIISLRHDKDSFKAHINASYSSMRSSIVKIALIASL